MNDSLIRVVCVTVLSGLAIASARAAHENPAEPAPAPAKEEAAKISMEAAIEVPTAYFFRGYNIVDSGYIVQPQAYVYWRALQREDFTLSPYIGTWANYTEQKGPRNPKHFDEIDYIAGAKLEMGNWTVDACWTLYTSPADSFGNAQDVTLAASYEIDLGNQITLTPSASVARQIANEDGRQTTYFEVALTTAYEPEDSHWSFEVPLVLGMGGDGFYQDDSGKHEFFGYASAAFVVRYAIDDNWSVAATVQYLYLIADSVVAANDGNENAVVGKIALEFAL